MDDKFSIRVNVADRYYPLKIERKMRRKFEGQPERLMKKFFNINKGTQIKMYRIFSYGCFTICDQGD